MGLSHKFNEDDVHSGPGRTLFLLSSLRNVNTKAWHNDEAHLPVAVTLPLLPLSGFLRFLLFRMSLERKTLYNNQSVTQFGACSPLVEPRSKSTRCTDPTGALCQVLTTAHCCRSRLIWCQKNGGLMFASSCFSSTRLDRSALSCVYVLMASSCRTSVCQEICLGEGTQNSPS